MFVFCSAPSLVQETTLIFINSKRWVSVVFFQINPCKTARSSEYSSESMQNVPFYKTRHNIFKRYLVLSAIIQWNNLDLNSTNSGCLNISRNSILKFITPSVNSAFNSHNTKEVEFITRLTLVESHFPEHRFKHSFQDLLNPISNCWLDIESFWLTCHK